LLLLYREGRLRDIRAAALFAMFSGFSKQIAISFRAAARFRNKWCAAALDKKHLPAR
jgi:hypothetical protein